MEMKQTIYITGEDLQRLRQILPRGGGSPYLRTLESRLEGASVVPEAPRDVVTIGSRFRMRDVETDHVAEYTLVLPELADINRGRISVLAPIGALLLGAQEQETITFSTPDSTRRLRIEAVVDED
ncbi:MAG TPA: GreA/GreB family elongation factor [Rhodothermales bacterium]